MSVLCLEERLGALPACAFVDEVAFGGASTRLKRPTRTSPVVKKTKAEKEESKRILKEQEREFKQKLKEERAKRKEELRRLNPRN